MSLTPNFGMNIPDSTDIVNLLTQCYPNFTIVDTALQAIKETGTTTATETKSGTTHQLVRTDADCNMLRFTATSNFVTGDSFTVDGNPVAGVAVNGTSLQTGDFLINSNVLAILNGGVLTLFAGGAVTPSASDVTYDNTGSGLTATDVQDAIDELKSDIPTSMAGSDITYDNSGSGLTATNVQDAIDEVNAKIVTGASISVTTDGVKTRQQMLNALFALVDHTKITPKSVLMYDTTVMQLNNLVPGTSYRFNSTYIASASSFRTTCIEMSASSSYSAYTAPSTYNDYSTYVDTAGKDITLTY